MSKTSRRKLRNGRKTPSAIRTAETKYIAGLVKDDPGYLPTVRNSTIASRLKKMGCWCWNPRTRQQW